MTTVYTPTAVRMLALGLYVDRAAAALPATATQTIFNVANGGILLTSFVGRVGTALGATATTVTVGVTPSGGGSAQNAGLATTVGAALVVAAAAGTPQLLIADSLYIPAGAITITTSATDTGTVRWTLSYIPYDTGATVQAA
jgi:hypothetical protein